MLAGLVAAVVVLAVSVVRQRARHRRVVTGMRAELLVQRSLDARRVEERTDEARRARAEAAELAERLDRVAREATAASLVLLSRMGREREEHTRALAAGTPVHSVLMLETAAGPVSG